MRKNKDLLKPVRVRNLVTYTGPLVKGYKKLKKVYGGPAWQLPSSINNRKVKKWLKVYLADDEDGDKFIPIFYESRKVWLRKQREHKKINRDLLHIALIIMIIWILYSILK